MRATLDRLVLIDIGRHVDLLHESKRDGKGIVAFWGW